VASESGLTIKDWVTLTLSILAFVVSAGSVYLSTIRQNDDLSIVAHNVPLVFLTDQNSLTVEQAESTIILINSGNRSATIISVGIFYRQHNDETKENCGGLSSWGSVMTFQTDLEPLVVKEKEVIARKVKIIDSKWYHKVNIKKTDTGTYTFPVKDEYRGKEYISVDVCLEVHLATPSVSSHRVIVLAQDYTVTAGGVFIGGGSDTEKIDWRKPKTLIKESGTIFER
jgi:hypothetical protein